MKKIFFILLFFTGNINIHAQPNQIHAKIIHHKITEKYYQGEIDSRFPISMYLKFTEYSEDHMEVYFVNGWYQYKSKNIKIPIEGLYTADKITLFQFKKNGYANIEKDAQNGKNIYQFIDSIESISTFIEKIQLDKQFQKRIEGIWTNGKNSFFITLNTNTWQVLEHKNNLVFTKNKKEYQVDLNKYIEPTATLEMISNVENDNEIKVILHYEYMSRPYVQGMCGAGQEIGYLLFVFDKNFQVKSHKDYLIESCLKSIYNAKLKEDKNVIEYLIKTDEYSEKEKAKDQILIINKMKANCTIK